MRILKTTPLLFVEAIEPVLDFWQGRLGYRAIAEAHHGERLAFVILKRESDEVMLQTLSEGWGDIPGVLNHVHGVTTALFHEVDSVDAVLAHLHGFKLLAGPRLAFYGKREIFLRDPAGFLHGFAEEPASGA